LAYARKLEAELNISKERDFKLGMRYILKEQAIRSIISLPDLVATPYKGVALGVERLGVTFVKPITMVQNHRAATLEAENIRNAGIGVNIGAARQNRMTRCFPRHAVTFEANYTPTSGNIEDKITEIDRIRGFLYLESLFLNTILFLSTINAIIRRPFFWPLYDNEHIPVSGNINIFVASWNVLKANLQIIYCFLVGYGIYKYIWVLMYKFHYDILSALAGPFLLNPIIGYHMIKEVRYVDPYRGCNFDLERIFRCYGAWWYCVFDWSLLPVFRGIKNVVSFIVTQGIKKSLQGIKLLVELILNKYEQTLALPTKMLVKKGVILELLHLVYTLVWIMWP
jgi:hypothetical protein